MLQSLSSALQLMRYFTSTQPAWGVRELARESGTHHAVVQRVLATFAAEGYLVQDAAGRYTLGLRWFEMGEIVRHVVSPTQAVEPILQHLARESGETVFLTLIDGNEGLCLDIVHSDQQLRFSIEEGQRFALHAGSHGKAILAFLPPEQREGICANAARTDARVDLAVLDGQLAQIRNQGWAYTREESAAGVAGLAVPVWSRTRQVVGSIAISGPVQRLDEAAIPRLLAPLQLAQPKIEGVVGLLR
ncbi:IclR family transcriptional regulator [Paraburkholderia sp. J63]|uniref:IclR family transcriptional regulator n=1 Tax=Paraburkholderia sp. J63 TaxID=2805434 RepID=UPI002ABD70CA|nr:IclR family transcriptional regulator [Paraburkholderia sp. J63]